MYTVTLPADLSADDAPFRQAARQALALGLSPGDVMFVEGEEISLFDALPPVDAPTAFKVPPGFVALMRHAICHRGEDRYALLYEILWRLTHGESGLLERRSDAAVARLNDYAKAVGRDVHKTHAFVRFAPRDVEGRVEHVAYFEPKHYSLRLSAPFFVDRFTQMDWRIETPIGTAVWRDGVLNFTPGFVRAGAAEPTDGDAAWDIYYRTTFNPARLRIDAMIKEMPKHYWRTMPETRAISDLVRKASARAETMIDRAVDAPPRFADRIAERMQSASTPAIGTPLEQLRGEASACTRCPLHARATQTVFGEGPKDAAVMLVGEQPGDSEDLAGRPFVGPAGQLLDRALGDAGLDRAALYVTNAVKHFKYEPRGKRRIHKKPSVGEITACRWWLKEEIETIQPKLIVALGATAAQSLIGRTVGVTRERGRFLDHAGSKLLITVHPSYLLRLPPAEAQSEYARFVADLRLIAAEEALVEKAA